MWINGKMMKGNRLGLSGLAVLAVGGLSGCMEVDNVNEYDVLETEALADTFYIFSGMTDDPSLAVASQIYSRGLDREANKMDREWVAQGNREYRQGTDIGEKVYFNIPKGAKVKIRSRVINLDNGKESKLSRYDFSAFLDGQNKNGNFPKNGYHIQHLNDDMRIIALFSAIKPEDVDGFYYKQLK